MRLRTWVVVVVVAAVLVTVGVATLSTDEEGRDQLSYRASIVVSGECRTPTIVLGERMWTTAETVPADRSGIVDGTLWVTGDEGLFIEEDGGLSLRYTLASADTSPPAACSFGG
jgi:hypothetical protein